MALTKQAATAAMVGLVALVTFYANPNFESKDFADYSSVRGKGRVPYGRLYQASYAGIIAASLTLPYFALRGRLRE